VPGNGSALDVVPRRCAIQIHDFTFTFFIFYGYRYLLINEDGK